MDRTFVAIKPDGVKRGLIGNIIRRIEHKKNNTKQGSFSNQNVFYGDFLKTRKKDIKGNPIYEQTRKNFNGQYEILNTIHTNYSTM